MEQIWIWLSQSLLGWATPALGVVVFGLLSVLVIAAAVAGLDRVGPFRSYQTGRELMRQNMAVASVVRSIIYAVTAVVITVLILALR